MPAIPAFAPRTPINAVPQQRIGIEVAGQPGAAMGRIAEAVGNLGRQIEETNREAQYQEGVVAFTESLAVARRQARDQQDPEQVMLEWNAGTQNSIDEVAETITDRRARAAFIQAARLSIARDTPQVESWQATRATQRATAALIARSGQLAEEAANNPARFGIVADEYDEALRAAVQSGALREDRAERMRAAFPRQANRARVQRDMERDPGATRRSLMDPQRHSALTPEDREDLVAEATALETERETVAQAAIATEERAAWQQADATARNVVPSLAAKIVGGNADPVAMGRDLENNRNLLSPRSYETARRVLSGDVAGFDDPDAVASLVVNAGASDPEDFQRDAELALSAGRITPGRFSSLMQVSGRAGGDTAEARAYRAGRGALAEAFDGPEELGMQAARDAALADLDQWALANPRATVAETRKAAEEISGMHRPAAVARGRATLPAPYAFDGWPDAIDETVIDAAEEALLGDVDSGRVAPGEAGRAARALNAWRYVLRQQEQAR